MGPPGEGCKREQRAPGAAECSVERSSSALGPCAGSSLVPQGSRELAGSCHRFFSPLQRCRLCPGFCRCFAPPLTALHALLPPDPLSLANVTLQPGRSPQELRVSWLESGGARDHLVQLSVAESLSVVRNVSVPRGVTQLVLGGLVPGSRYRLEIISQAGPHRISSQTAVGYTGRTQPLPCLGRAGAKKGVPGQF